MSVHFGEEGGRLDYSSYLHLTELLSLQERLTTAPDELLFITVHQVYELWFKVLLGELVAIRDRLDSVAAAGGSLVTARHGLRRVEVIERLLVEQVDVLETMAPQDFLAFRAELAPASGFQSVQFREIEYLSGLRDPAYLDRLVMTAEERARLVHRLTEPSLWDAFVALLAARDVPLSDLLKATTGEHRELFEVAEGLMSHDEAFSLWRSRHVLMVERQIGSKSGTGGSTGAAYLRTTLDKRFFPGLWALRSSL